MLSNEEILFVKFSALFCFDERFICFIHKFICTNQKQRGRENQEREKEREKHTVRNKRSSIERVIHFHRKIVLTNNCICQSQCQQ